MRIEGTYTFPGTIQRIFTALVEPQALARLLPGCQRVIQLGPSVDGALTFEARLLPTTDTSSPLTLALRVIKLRRPDHLRVELRAYGLHSAVSGRGSIDLVADEAHTIGAWRFDLDSADERPLALTDQDGKRIAHLLCERLSRDLLLGYTPVATSSPTTSNAHEADAPQTLAETARGRIIALPRATANASLGQSMAHWAQRALWLGVGVAIGMSAVGLMLGALGLARRMSDRA